jgi:hypothetical protein
VIPQSNTPNDVPLRILWAGQAYKGTAKPIVQTYKDGVYLEHAVTLNGHYIGMIQCTGESWRMDNRGVAQGLVDAIGNYIFMWYE